jgi:hypothetical protein
MTKEQMSKEEIYVLAYCEKCESNTRHEKTICTKCVKQETKQQAESLIEKYEPYAHTNWYNAKQCAILEVQSKIDLLEECNKHLKEYGLEMLGKLDHQKEILKYLEEL